ncbi:hypothetical protein PMAYCL1PPCAC_00567, partial [Pristionchus mayeri]
FTEYDIQERYRKGCFEDSFHFYFVKTDCYAGYSVSTATLEELDTFIVEASHLRVPSDGLPPETAISHRREQIRCLKEDISELGEECEDILQVMERIREMENYEKEFPMANMNEFISELCEPPTYKIFYKDDENDP